GNSGFVAFEINRAQLALVASSAMPYGNVSGIAASAGALLDLGQRFVRYIGSDLLIRQPGLEPQRGSNRSVSLDRHKNQPLANSLWLLALVLSALRALTSS